jgi:hypothetical protein
VLVLLCDALLQSGGTGAQGVFRMSGSASEVQTLKDALNSGYYTPAKRQELVSNSFCYCYCCCCCCLVLLCELVFDD